VLGTHGTASLTGSASGLVRGMDPPTMTGTFSLLLDSSRVGRTRIARGAIDARSENGIVAATIEGETSDGNIRLQASAEPFAEQPSLTVKEARFEGLDLGGLFLDKDGATDLNGSARLRLVMEPTPDPQTGKAGAGSQRRPGLAGNVQIDLGASRIYRQEIVSAAVAGELTGQIAAVELDLRTPEGGALLSGNVEMFQEFPDMRFTDGRLEHLDIGALAGIDSLSTDISGRLSVDLQGASWETASGSVSLDLLPSRINREPISEAKVVADLMRGEVSLRGFSVLRAGTLNVVASGTYGDDRISFATNADADLHDLSRLTRDSSLTGSGGHVSLAAEGVWGAPDITRISGRVIANGRLDSLQVDSLVSVLSVAGRTIQVDSLVVRSNAGLIRGGGTIAVFDTTGQAESNFTLSASLASLHRLRRISGLDFSRSGTAQLDASLTGTGRAGKLGFSAAVANLGMEGVLIPAFKVHGSARLGPGPTFDAVRAEADGTDLAIGELVCDSVSAQLNTDGSTSTFRSSVDLEGGESLRIAGAGAELENGYRVTLDSLALNMGDRHWLLEHPAHIEVGTGLTIDDLSLSSGARKITAHGTLDPQGQQDFTLKIDSLAFDRFARLLGRPNLNGELTFSGLVTGPAHNARATGRLDAYILSGDTLVGKIESDAEWSGGLATVTSVVTQPDQSQLKAVISVPASLPFVSGPSRPTTSPDSARNGRREFSLQTDGFDLRFLEPFFNSQAMPEPRGMLTADITLREVGGKFSGTGRIGIDTGFVRVNSIGVEYSDIRLGASLQGSDFVIDTLSLRTGNGGIEAAGTVLLASLENPGIDLLVKLNKFVGINTQAMRAVADGSIKLAGTLKRPLITGDVTVDEANFVVPETAAEGEVETVVLMDADYEILRERFGYRRPAPRSSSADDTTRVSLDVALHFPRRSWIRKKANPSLSVEIEGNLNIRSTAGEALSLVGILKPVPGRSYVSQFGRQFEIKSGEIRFDGPPGEFNMNVDSEYKVPARSGSGMSEATIRMRVERKLDRFEFNLSSDPPMEQADILSYLTTGKASTGAFASTSSQGNLATSAALEQVVGAIGGLTEDKIPLDIFQIRQDGARGITIVAGNYVNPKTYVGVRYPILLQQTGQDNYYDIGTEFEVEYQSFPWLFWNARGGSTRLMLLMKSRYAY
jgi:translocation and assembly module TamB